MNSVALARKQNNGETLHVYSVSILKEIYNQIHY